MSKFCTKCGAELPDDAAFCSKCGTSTQEKMQNTTAQETKEEEMIESTGPAALDLKSALGLIYEVQNYIENADVIDKSGFKTTEKKLLDAEKLINKAKESDGTVKVLFPNTNTLFTCKEALAYNNYILGRLGFGCTLDTIHGRATRVHALKKVQMKFQESLEIIPNPEVAFYYAVAMHEELNFKTQTTIMPQGKLKQAVKQAYQYVIDEWPDSEFSIEARKNQAQL